MDTAGDPTAWHLPTRLSLDADHRVDPTLSRLEERELVSLLAWARSKDDATIPNVRRVAVTTRCW